jgi:hypothetical protein
MFVFLYVLLKATFSCSDHTESMVGVWSIGGMTLRDESRNTRRIKRSRNVNVILRRVRVTISVMETQ